ncbi:hypothetical protein C6H65_00395 [Photorhabdus luminescens]|nr:hypothetical protein C6H65_00395 [Photorhabdus luminescens]
MVSNNQYIHEMVAVFYNHSPSLCEFFSERKILLRNFFQFNVKNTQKELIVIFNISFYYI